MGRIIIITLKGVKHMKYFIATISTQYDGLNNTYHLPVKGRDEGEASETINYKEYQHNGDELAELVAINEIPEADYNVLVKYL